jgi:phage terminase small subunit
MSAQPATLYEFDRESGAVDKKVNRPRRKMESELSKAEEALAIGDKITLDANLEIPMNVKTNLIAKKKWERITDLYIAAGIRFVSTADLETLEQYCLTWSDFDALIKLKKRLNREYKEDIPRLTAYNKYKVDEKFINLNMLLIKLSSLLYLNPASRIKHYGQKKKEEDQENRTKNMFGD